MPVFGEKLVKVDSYRSEEVDPGFPATNPQVKNVLSYGDT